MKPVIGRRGSAEVRYRERRALAYATAEALVRTDLPAACELRPIEPSALHAFAECWDGLPARRYAWPWGDIAAEFRRNHPDRFEVAVWSGGALCGLAIGRVSAGPLYCGVNFLEGCPGQHPLRGFIVGIVIATAEAYAVAIGKGAVRLIDPLPDLVPLYAKYGYSLASPRRESPYCWKMAENGP